MRFENDAGSAVWVQISMFNPFRKRKSRVPRATKFLAVDAWIDSTLYEAGFRARERWEAITIFFRRFRVKGWRRGLIELASEGFTMGTAGAIVLLALALPAFEETARDWRSQDDYAVTFLDRYGNEIGQRGIIQRDSVPVDEIPDHVIKAVLDAAGIDGAHILARIGDADVKAKLVANTENAVERGAFGIPTFYVDGDIYFGKDRLRDVEEAIAG